MIPLGIRIIENESLTVSARRRRTWPERLLSWPWRPWRPWTYYNAPDPTVYKMAATPTSPELLIMHPLLADQFRDAYSKGTTT